MGHFPIISLEKGINPVHTQYQEAGGTLGRTKRPKIKEPEAGSSGSLLERKNESGARRGLRLPKAVREVGRPAMGQTADLAVAAAGSAVFCFTPKYGPNGGALRRGDRDVQGRTLPEGRFQGPRDAARPISPCL